MSNVASSVARTVGRFGRSVAQDGDFERFRYDGREWTIFRRLVKGARQRNYSIKLEREKKVVFHSLGTSRKGEAVAVAKLKIDLIRRGHWERLRDSRLRQDQAMATVGDLVEAFTSRVALFNDSLRPEVARAYGQKLRTMVRVGLGVEDADAVSSAMLTEDLVDRFRANYLLPHGADVTRREAAKRGGRSIIANAKAMFSPLAMKCYAGLRLPACDGEKAFAGFRAASNFRGVKERDVVPIDGVMMQGIARASLAMRESDAALYLVHLCYRHLGMRDIEIAAARWSWLVRRTSAPTADDPAVGDMVIVQRPYFDPKKSQGRVPVAAEVWAEFERCRKGAEEPLIAAEHATARHDLIYKSHSAFMRRFLPAADYGKSSYELRRWSSSVVRRRQGSDAQEQFLRHKAKTVAGLHYSYEGALRPITFADCGLD